MRNPEEFDAFYKDARDRLLLQTYALTGDLTASRAAVRDCFVVAWHQWRKISRLDDPEAWARPHAWAHAQRRHTARLWHRDKGLDPEIRATLDALGKLPVVQRKALLLTQLTTISLNDMAREIGLPRAEAERELQSATARLAVHRDVPTTSIRLLLEPLREHVATVSWPRATIIRRAGAARRRTHTTVAALVAVAGLVLTGSLVTDQAGVRPNLGREHVSSNGAHGRDLSGSATEPDAAPVELSGNNLLTTRQVAASVPGRHWRTTATHDNTAGDGLVLPCQQQRYADPDGVAALVRKFGTSPGKAAPRVSAIEATEVSTTQRRARATYDATLGWYAGCVDRRVQLLSTRRVTGVGDRAALLVLRAWDRPVTTMVVGVARTGQLTTTTMTRVTHTQTPDFGGTARLLATAVDGLCHLPEAGACSTRPKLTVVNPVPAGEVTSMLDEVDLPPVSGVERPWVGTEARKALDNDAATRCDQADFSAPPMTNNVTRSFVIPKAKLSVQFGLTETVGSLPASRAQAFVKQVRARMAACSDKDLGTDVSLVTQLATPRQDLSVWRLTTEISDNASVEYFMGIVRSGTSVAQIGFVPDRKVAMAPGAFGDLVDRALDRLAQMPPPRTRN